MFWQEKTSSEMTDQEWESLCDGCGRCCVWKFEDETTREILYTNIRCSLFNHDSCRCSDYQHRSESIPDCMNIRNLTDQQYAWLPDTCAYRLIHEAKPLFDWHPLRCGDPDRVHQAGISLRNKTVSGDGLTEEDIIRHIIDPDTPTHAAD